MYEGHDEVVKGPRDDDAVVDVEPEHDGHGGVAHSLKIPTSERPIKGINQILRKFATGIQNSWKLFL